MKIENYKYDTIEEQDFLIQSLNLNELKNLTGKSVFSENVVEEPIIETEIIETDADIQKMSISELKKFVEKSKPKEKYTIQYKITHTGLDENTILLIETNKYRATLEQLISYCKGLKISYRDFLPELF